MKDQVAIIGAGISGISLAKIIGDDAEAVVFEQRTKIGGLISCDNINGYLYHKVGGHVFNSKNQQVLNWFWQFFDRDTEFTPLTRVAKVFMDNQLIGYPIEDYLYQLDKGIVTRVIDELLNPVQSAPAANFEDFLKKSFGETLYQLYFKPYNEKIWNVDLSAVPLDWLDGKLPMPNFRDILINNILRREEREMVHAYFYYPKNGGSQFIIDRLAKGVKCVNNANINNIEIRAAGHIYVNDNGPFKKLVYTGDVRKLAGSINGVKFDPQLVKGLSALRSNGTTNVLCKCDKNDLSWIYLPEKKYKAHRIIYTGNFSVNNNAGDERSSCTVEFSNYISEQDAREAIKELPGNLEFLAYNHEPNSYVIQDTDTRQVLSIFKAELKKHQIYLLGRMAEWEYYNMDKVIEAAFILKDEVLKPV